MRLSARRAASAVRFQAIKIPQKWGAPRVHTLFASRLSESVAVLAVAEKARHRYSIVCGQTGDPYVTVVCAECWRVCASRRRGGTTMLLRVRAQHYKLAVTDPQPDPNARWTCVCLSTSAASRVRLLANTPEHPGPLQRQEGLKAASCRPPRKQAVLFSRTPGKSPPSSQRSC